jgi:dTMP kinase
MSLFITFEGIEGCGKSTQIRRLANALSAKGLPCLLTREPGGCPISDQIRAILLNAENSAMKPATELLLYAAARAQHVSETISPALAEGKLVLCDRFSDATLAYQGFGRNLDIEVIQYLNRLAMGDVKPDLTVLIDCPVEVGITRAIARNNAIPGDKEERFERESLLFHERVRQGYLKLAQAEPGRFVIIDGTMDADVTEAAVCNSMRSRIPGF